MKKRENMSTQNTNTHVENTSLAVVDVHQKQQLNHHQEEEENGGQGDVLRSSVHSHSSSQHHHHTWVARWTRNYLDVQNSMRMWLGTNILTVTWIVSMLGALVGPIAFVVLAIVVYRTLLSLLRVKNHFPDSHKLVTFGAVADRALDSPLGSKLVDALVVFIQFCWCAGYVVFAGENLAHVTEHNISFNVSAIIIASSIFLVSIISGDPKVLAKISVFTNALILTSSLTVATQYNLNGVVERGGDDGGSSDIHHHHHNTSGGHNNFTNTTNAPPLNDGGEVKLFQPALSSMIGLATMSSALGGLPTALDVQRTMPQKGRFHAITRFTLSFVVGLLTILGFFGYLSFRSNSCSVISLSLQKGTPVRKFVEIVLVISPVFEAVMNSFQMLLIIASRFNWHSTLHFVAMRLVLFIICTLIAIFIPFYGLISAVGGGISGAGLCFVLPTIMELTLLNRIEKEENEKKTNKKKKKKKSSSGLSGTNNEGETEEEGESPKMEGGYNYGATTTSSDQENQVIKNNNNDDDDNESEDSSEPDPALLELEKEDKVVPSRKPELYVILAAGTIILFLGAGAAINKIVENVSGSSSVPEQCK